MPADARRPRPRGPAARASTAGPPAPEVEGEVKGRAAILFSGTTWHLVAQKAAEELAAHYGVAAELWSATSYKRLREDALAVERWNRLHPTEAPRTPYVTERLAGRRRSGRGRVATSCGPSPTRSPAGCPGDWLSLGTDGFGRSDTRAALRRFFEIDHAHLVVGVLSQLALRGEVKTRDRRRGHPPLRHRSRSARPVEPGGLVSSARRSGLRDGLDAALAGRSRPSSGRSRSIRSPPDWPRSSATAPATSRAARSATSWRCPKRCSRSPSWRRPAGG